MFLGWEFGEKEECERGKSEFEKPIAFSEWEWGAVIPSENIMRGASVAAPCHTALYQLPSSNPAARHHMHGRVSSRARLGKICKIDAGPGQRA